MFIEFENFKLDSDRRELSCCGELVAVQPQVFDLLVCIINNRERVVSRDDLIADVWAGRIVSESTLATRINAARKALRDSGETQRLIRTVRGKGIRFIGEIVDEISPPDQTKVTPLRVIPETRIAVMPLENRSHDEYLAEFAENLIEDFITELSRNWTRYGVECHREKTQAKYAVQGSVGVSANLSASASI